MLGNEYIGGFAIFIVTLLILKIFWRRTFSKKYISKCKILVTGCDTGFGRQLVETLDAQTNCVVIAGCLTEDAVSDIKLSCSGRVITLHLDISNTKSVKEAYENLYEQFKDEGKKWLFPMRNN